MHIPKIETYCIIIKTSFSVGFYCSKQNDMTLLIKRWRYQDNLQRLNGSMKWQEDFLDFNLLADYLLTSSKFYGELNASVNSTIPALPRAAAVARHAVVWRNSADTLLSFQVSIMLTHPNATSLLIVPHLITNVASASLSYDTCKRRRGYLIPKGDP